ncbi:MAG: hypothetical protein AB7E48_08360 [Deferribacterales bacterium]
MAGCYGDDKTIYLDDYVNGSGNSGGGSDAPDEPEEPEEPGEVPVTGEEIFLAYCSCHEFSPHLFTPAAFHHPFELDPEPTLEQLELVDEYLRNNAEPEEPEEPVDPSDPVAAGQAVFNSDCAGCHNGTTAPTVSNAIFEDFGTASLDDHPFPIAVTVEEIGYLIEYIESVRP